MMKWHLVLVLLAVFWRVQATEENEPATTNAESETAVKQMKPEVECSRVGGLCLEKTECPEDRVSQEGKCPTQPEAVCCHSLGRSATLCQSLGGHCRTTCPEELTLTRAVDCGENEKCCPLV